MARGPLGHIRFISPFLMLVGIAGLPPAVPTSTAVHGGPAWLPFVPTSSLELSSVSPSLGVWGSCGEGPDCRLPPPATWKR